LDVKPVETAVAGDSYGNDIVPAKELGCSTIWLKGKGWNEPENTGSADFIITSLIQILKIL
jgi:putative hydrolase of the HAD superfamily